ncbi:MAG: OmpH family outer membrane protein [Paludibacteraceae bacterium]|nr:OmpH family outer membrane protein [Paludibacteraceae bacterium]
MNKSQIIINAVLAAAVVALFIVVYQIKPATPKQQVEEVVVEGELLPIAIVNTDSILKYYTLAVESSEKLMSSYEASMVQLDTKARAFQKEYETFQKDAMDFQRKVEAGAFLSRERAESEQARLQTKGQQLEKKQVDLENLRQKLSNDFAVQQQELTLQLADSIQTFLKDFNADGRYHLILNEAALMNKVAGYDVTNEVVEGLNARYTK